MSLRCFVAAAVQMCAGSDKAENLAKAERFVHDALRHGARLVVFPEVFLWRGPRAEERHAAESIPGPLTERLSAVARRADVYLLAGSILERSDGERPYNTSLLFAPSGDIIGRYRKIHLFDVDIVGHVSIRESETRAAGDALVTIPTELGVIGMSVCYDLRFPELYRQLTRSGAEILAVPSAFTFPTGAAHWEILTRARAIENQVYVIAPNQVGRSPTGIVDFGNSLIVDPWGIPLARAADREMLIFADIDRDHQERIRRELPALHHARLGR